MLEPHNEMCSVTGRLPQEEETAEEEEENAQDLQPFPAIPPEKGGRVFPANGKQWRQFDFPLA